MENAFEGSKVFPTGSRAWKGLHLNPLPAIAAGDDMHAFEALSGHFGMRIVPMLAPETNYFVWLREPRQRLISAFFFRVLQERENKALLERLDGGARIESVFLDWIKPGFALQAQLVAGRREFAEWRHANRGADLDAAAVAGLRQCFFIGLTEDLDRSVDALCALTSILPPKQAVKRNVGVKKTAGFSFTREEEERFAAILEPQLAFYRLATEIYKRQMDTLQARAEEIPALSFIGRREELRRHILTLPASRRLARIDEWQAWDAVLGENLDSREEFIAPDGHRGRWRWTCPGPDTFLYFDFPRTDFRLTLRLNPATPMENAGNAVIRLGGHRLLTELQRTTHGRIELVCDVDQALAELLPAPAELHIHTPVMLDEGTLVPYAGTRKLGIALESIAFAPASPESPPTRRSLQFST